MRPAEAFGDLRRMNRPVVTTREAATRWQVDQGTAGRRLRNLAEAGVIARIRRGLWSLDPEVDPLVVVPFLTSPFPAYLSLWSALRRHGMIDQIPREISIASLDRARRIETSLGTYSVHHLAPAVFTGFTGSEDAGYIALPEKALFDAVYVRAAAGSRAYFPELALPARWDERRLHKWTRLIESKRLRTLVARHLTEAL